MTKIGRAGDGTLLPSTLPQKGAQMSEKKRGGARPGAGRPKVLHDLAVQEIRRRQQRGDTQEALARAFRVSRSTIGRVMTYRGPYA